MSLTIVTSGGLSAVNISDGYPVFSIKYFLPIYDHTIDPTIHSTDSSIVTSAEPLSGASLVSTTHGTLVGEKIWNHNNSTSAYTITDNNYHVYRNSGGTYTNASNLYEDSTMQNATTVNLLSGADGIYPLSDIISGADAPAITSADETNGSDFTWASSTTAVSANNNDVLALNYQNLWDGVSYTPSSSDLDPLSATAALFHCTIPNSAGDFKFNKVALYVQKVLTTGVSDTSEPPILFGVAVLNNAIEVTNDIDGIQTFTLDVKLQFSVDNLTTNTIYHDTDYWYKLPPAVSSPYGLFAVGDVAIGTSANNGSWNPNAKLHLTDSQKPQLILSKTYTNDEAIFEMKTDGSLGITTSGTVGTLAVGPNTVASGEESVAFGEGGTASGEQSTVMGKGGLAAGTASTSLGFHAVANGHSSVAAGWRTYANSTGAMSIGVYTSATGYASFALGDTTSASGQSSFAAGASAHADGVASFALGYKTSASGNKSTALGSLNRSEGSFSTTLGQSNKATGQWSIAGGYKTSATEEKAVTFGNDNIASGISSTALGSYNTASGNFSTTMGQSNKAIGSKSVAGGFKTSAEGVASMAFGDYNLTSGGYSVALGSYNTSQGLHSTTLGRLNKAIGTNSLAFGYSSSATETNSIAFGNQSIASGVGAAAIGTSNTSQGIYSTTLGYDNTVTEYASIAGGFDNYNEAKYSCLFGQSNYAYKGVPSDDNSKGIFINGSYNTSYGPHSVAFGLSHFIGSNDRTRTYNGMYNAVFGYNHTVNGNCDGQANLVAGRSAEISGSYNISVGENHDIAENASYNAQFGYNNDIDVGSYNIVGGSNNSTSGSRNLIEGAGSTILGDYNIVNGINQNVRGDNNLVIGETMQQPLSADNVIVQTQNGVSWLRYIYSGTFAASTAAQTEFDLNSDENFRFTLNSGKTIQAVNVNLLVMSYNDNSQSMDSEYKSFKFAFNGSNVVMEDGPEIFSGNNGTISKLDYLEPVTPTAFPWELYFKVKTVGGTAGVTHAVMMNADIQAHQI